MVKMPAWAITGFDIPLNELLKYTVPVPHGNCTHWCSCWLPCLQRKGEESVGGCGLVASAAAGPCPESLLVMQMAQFHPGQEGQCGSARALTSFMVTKKHQDNLFRH